jgi:transcriptional repressor NrdR
MICPFCRNDGDKVIDSRSSGNSIRRRRECTECGRRFTTYEYIEIVPLTVIKRDGTREPFLREKVLGGILMACKKRPISHEQINDLVNNVENELATSENHEVSFDQIGNKVMEQLSVLDPVAYVRFASVYREFKDCGEFVDQIRQIKV